MDYKFIYTEIWERQQTFFKIQNEKQQQNSVVFSPLAKNTNKFSEK
jgi:hypothetical protein